MSLVEVLECVNNFGFPIVISLYFIFKVEKVVQNNTRALTEVSLTIQHCKKK